MPAFLPPNLLALFAPRPALPYEKPYDKLPWDKPRTGKYAYDCVSDTIDKFEKAEDQPLPIREETKEERKARIRKMKLDEHKRDMQDDLLDWNPNKNRESTVDPYKTLFVGRLDYTTSEKRILREFEQFGRVLEVKLVLDKLTGKSRGYAFVEFENEKDMRYAYKQGDRMKIDGRQVLIDVERGRTVEGWRPRRFGGGLGDTRATRAKGVKRPKNAPETISLHDTVQAARDGPNGLKTTIPQNHRYNKYDSEDRGGGSFVKSHRDFSDDKNKRNQGKKDDNDRARFHARPPMKERSGLQYSRGGFDFGDGGFFGTDVQRFDSRSERWRGNMERKGSGNRNHDEDIWAGGSKKKNSQKIFEKNSDFFTQPPLPWAASPATQNATSPPNPAATTDPNHPTNAKTAPKTDPNPNANGTAIKSTKTKTTTGTAIEKIPASLNLKGRDEIILWRMTVGVVVRGVGKLGVSIMWGGLRRWGRGIWL